MSAGDDAWNTIDFFCAASASVLYSNDDALDVNIFSNRIQSDLRPPPSFQTNQLSNI